jgi:hypothetical protein
MFGVDQWWVLKKRKKKKVFLVSETDPSTWLTKEKIRTEPTDCKTDWKKRCPSALSRAKSFESGGQRNLIRFEKSVRHVSKVKSVPQRDQSLFLSNHAYKPGPCSCRRSLEPSQHTRDHH